jgi:hypothetical protein
MPVVLRYKGYKFFFFSNEGTPREPRHIHVRKGESIAKCCLEPEIKLADSFGFNSSELKEIFNVVIENKELIERKWYEYFGE